MADHKRIHGIFLRYQLKSELLFKCSKERWERWMGQISICPIRNWRNWHPRIQFEIKEPFGATLVQYRAIHKSGQDLREIYHANGLTFEAAARTSRKSMTDDGSRRDC